MQISRKPFWIIMRNDGSYVLTSASLYRRNAVGDAVMIYGKPWKTLRRKVGMNVYKVRLIPV